MGLIRCNGGVIEFRGWCCLCLWLLGLGCPSDSLLGVRVGCHDGGGGDGRWAVWAFPDHLGAVAANDVAPA